MSSNNEHERRHEQIRRMQQLDQSLATMGEQFPLMWRRMYDNMLAEGFEVQDAMAILQAYVHGLGGGKFTPR